MKRTLMALMLVLCLALPLLAGAEVVTLPLDFSGGLDPVSDYPAQRDAPGYDAYEDLSITATYERVVSPEWHVTCYIARIKIANGSQLRTASFNGFDKSKGTAPTQTMARRNKAIVACNGDYFTGDAGRFVLRQGQVFRKDMREGQDVLLIDEDGDFHLILADEHPETMDKTTIDGKRVNNALCFGPALIRDGEIVVDYERTQRVSHPKNREQRIAICQTGPLEYMIVTVAHWGMDLQSFTEFIASFGNVRHAYNLDGGNSCHLVFMGNWRNKLADEEYRNVPDIVYFASAWQAE